MPGTLHIFRRKPDPPQYQVNINVGANSWVRVLDAHGLDEFLRHTWGLPESETEAMLGNSAPPGTRPRPWWTYRKLTWPKWASPNRPATSSSRLHCELFAEDAHVLAALIDMDAKRVQCLIQLVAFQLR